MDQAEIGIGLLGVGNVGSAFLTLLRERSRELEARIGRPLVVRKACVRHPSPERRRSLDLELSGDPMEVVKDESVQVVVEVMGGVSPAKEAIEAAIGLGKPVVSANKDLFATWGMVLAEKAAAAKVPLLYEAAVGGAIPLVRVLRESLAGEAIERVTGIVNGTTNYVLSLMASEGITQQEALDRAVELGYAEPDPSADVKGYDAACKAAIIAYLAFRAPMTVGDVYYEGIEAIGPEDLEAARKHGYEVKLLSVVEATEGTPRGVRARVHPTLVPASHPLASVQGAYNAIFIEGAALGELMLYGRGAGGLPTATAVLGDVVEVAGNLGTARSVLPPPDRTVVPVGMADLSVPYFIEMDVVDRPGVLAAIASVFGSHSVSIWRMEQVGVGEEARLVFITHEAREELVHRTIGEVVRLDSVKRLGAFLRMLR
jgi:homoserine dehydrogenase